MKKLSHKLLTRFFWKGTGLFLVLLGALVLVGWHSGLPLLIQVHPSLVPMQYNTALGFLLIGLAMLGIHFGYGKISAALGATVALIGALTLIEYLFAVNLGIDQLFMEHYITVKTSHPGRMAPNTALNFLLVGLYLAINFVAMKGQKKNILQTLLVSAVFVLSAVAFFGYLLELEAAYGWHTFTRMAVHTALGFMLFSAGILGNLIFHAAPASRRVWLPLPVSAGIFMVFVLFAQALHQKEAQQVEKNLLLEEHLVNHQIRLMLKEHEKALRRMTNRYAGYQEIPENEWFATARLFLQDIEGLVGIWRADREHRLTWAYPQTQMPAAAGAGLSLQEESERVIEKSMREKTLVASRTVDLVQGGRVFFLALPMFSDETFQGHTLFLYRLDAMFKKIIELIEYKFHVVILENNAAAYDVAGHTVAPADVSRFVMTLDRIGYDWRIEIRPLETFVESLKTKNAQYVLFFGLLVSSLLGLMLHFLLLKNEKNRQLIESRERLLAITSSAQDAIILIDDRGTLAYWNPKAKEMLGYDAEELKGKDFHSVIAPARFLDAYKKAYRQFAKTGEGAAIGKTLELAAIRKDGTELPVSISLNGVKLNNRWHGVGITRDISEQKKMEQELEKKEKMMIAQSRQAAMGDMISMIAHQWRQPLSSISAISGTLTMDIMLDDYKKEFFLEHLEAITNLSQNLSTTIDDFRNFYRPNKQKETFLLSDAVDASVEIIRTGLISNNIKVVTEYEPLEPINNYRNELMQVFLNILKNAKDAFIEKRTPEPSIVITISKDETSGQVISIKDNAGGIRNDVINKIFDPYFSTKDEKTGTGLGLYMSKTIVEEHCGGSITVKNRDGGAEFRIVLQRDEAARIPS